MKIKELEQIIKSNDQIIIYGAGKVARELICYIKKNDLVSKVHCIVVTDFAANPTEIEGIPVRAVWDLYGEYEQYLCIIATYEKFHTSINETITALGIKNTLFLKDDLIDEIINNNKIKIVEGKKYKKIVFYAYRDCMMGISGGPGAALFLQQKFLGEEFDGIPIEYKYKNNSKFLSKFRGEFLGGIIQVIFEQLFKNKTLYISNDLGTAYGLALLKKDYIVMFHHQGPIVKENLDYGQKQSKRRINFLKELERKAFINAKRVIFPSRGAAEMYLQSEYAAVKREEICLSEPLYNTICEIKKENRIEKDDTKLTFMSLGTVSSAKGQDLSLKFIEHFLEKYDKSVRYIVIGRGPMINEVNAYALKMMNRFDNFEYIYIPRLDPYSEIIRVHQLADIYIMMHRISIFDLSTLEAMSNSSALILSNVGGNPEFNMEENVILVDKDDYLSAIDILVKSNIADLKCKNKTVYDKYFSPDGFRKRYYNMLEEEIHGK